MLLAAKDNGSLGFRMVRVLDSLGVRRKKENGTSPPVERCWVTALYLCCSARAG